MAKVALLIGVSEYEVGLAPLPAAVKDVVALERILKDSEMGDFDEVKILTNPEPQAMQYEVETLFSGRSKDDFVLLFFSGHGIKDDSNNLYFATRITRKSAKGDLIRSTAVPARFVHEVMNNSRAKRQAIILDCCFSGAFDPSLQSKDDGSVDLQGQLGAEGRVVLTSSSSTQYSFEQQGSDLSLYTRYLIEGIETGAGDRDEDGKISVRELHEYAAGKVHETAPSMTPKLITLKDLGFDLVLAKAKVTDPSLRYRRQVEKYSSRGAISSIGRTILNKLQIQLGLSTQVAKEIETEVLRPYQERLDNIQLYQDEFSKAVKHEHPLSSHVVSELENLLDILGLRREDVAEIEQKIIAQVSLNPQTIREEYQQKLQRYKQEFCRAIDAEYPFSDYVHKGLTDFQQFLGLKDEDIDEIHQNVISSKQRGSNFLPTIAEAEQQVQEKVDGRVVKQENQLDLSIVSGDDPSSAKEIDYCDLRNALKEGDWQLADYITYQVISQIFNQKISVEPELETKQESGIKGMKNTSLSFLKKTLNVVKTWDTKSWNETSNSILNFPCTDLQTIDRLWTQYSNGRFGFSVQKDIFANLSVELNGKYPGDVIWQKFGESVGWQFNGEWIHLEDWKFDISALPGHLPSLGWTVNYFGSWGGVDALAGIATYGLYIAGKVAYLDYRKNKFGFADCGPAFASLASRLLICNL